MSADTGPNGTGPNGTGRTSANGRPARRAPLRAPGHEPARANGATATPVMEAPGDETGVIPQYVAGPPLAPSPVEPVAGIPDVSEVMAAAPPPELGDTKAGLAGYSPVPLLILFGLNLVDELDRVIFGTLAPEIRDDFNLSITGIVTLTSLVGIIALGLQVVVGYYGDRGNRVRLAIIGASIWSVFSFGTGIAPGLFVLGLTRVGSSVGKLVNDPTHRSLLSDYYPPKARPFAFYVHTAANNVGIIIAPFAGGALAAVFGWRTPFIVFAIPTAILVFIAITKLREPVRGRHEREAAGADMELAQQEEDPPSFGEAWRSVHQIRSLRRVLFSLPFLSATYTGFVVLLSNFYDDEFGSTEFEIGAIFSAVNVVTVLCLVALLRMTTRFLTSEPRKIFYMVAASAPVAAVSYVGVAWTRNFTLSVVFLGLLSAANAPLNAGIPALLSMVIPPRVRSVGFAIGSLYILPGFFLVIFVAGLADTKGYSFAFLALTPFLLIGTAILVSGGNFVADDIARIQASALAQAIATRSRQRGEAKLLVAKGVDVHYGQTQVLFGVDIEVDDGEIVALLGTNGAGKSTFLNALTGLVDPSAGAIIFDGRDITNLPANEAVALGIVMVPGGKGVFPTMTVKENMELAAWLFDKEPERVKEATETVLEYFPILRKRWNEKAGNMSGGEQQMLTLGQAFIAKPKLLVIDELSLGLAPVVVEQLLGIVEAIHEQGTTIILVEQSVNVAITVAERAIFMEKGEVRFDGPTAELLERPDVLRAVFLQGAGAKDKDVEEALKPSLVIDRAERMELLARAPVALETRGLSVRFGGIQAVNRVDLSLRQGEIIGLIGPNGAGKTTIMDLVSGFLVPTAGRVLLHGKDVTELTPDLRAAAGLGRSFQDAKLFPSLTVAETLAVALERHIVTKDALAAALASPATREAEAAVRERVDELIELMNLQAFANKFISELSTGSRRVVDLACSLAHEPSVLLLDEPSSGIAQKETEALGPVLLDIRDKTGAALIVIEHDMPLIQAISDQLVALEVGAVVTQGDPSEVIAHPRVIEAYLGGTAEVINRSGGADDHVSDELVGARSVGAKAERAGGGYDRRSAPLGADRAGEEI